MTAGRITAPDLALARLCTAIRAQHRALTARLGQPGATRESLRMQHDRLAGMIEAHLIITGQPAGTARAVVNAHAWWMFTFDLADLATKISRRAS